MGIMLEQIIKQENGLYAVFSSFFSNFLISDATSEELVEYYIGREKDRFSQEKRDSLIIKQEIMSVIESLESGQRPYGKLTLTLEQARRKAIEINGKSNI